MYGDGLQRAKILVIIEKSLGQVGLQNVHKPSLYYLQSSNLIVFEDSKRFRRTSATKDILLPDPTPPLSTPIEVPRADKFMKIYINHPQPTCFYPVKWRLEIPSRLGGVRRQSKRVTDRPTDRQTDRQTDRHALKRLLCIRSEKFFFFFFFQDKSLG